MTATSGKALEQLAQRYANFIEANPEVSVGHSCYAVTTGRAALEQRAVFNGHDSQPDVLVKSLKGFDDLYSDVDVRFVLYVTKEGYDRRMWRSSGSSSSWLPPWKTTNMTCFDTHFQIV